jgi:hypothetical protein
VQLRDGPSSTVPISGRARQIGQRSDLSRNLLFGRDGDMCCCLGGGDEASSEKTEAYVCFCICQSFPRVGLSCSRCGGVVHGRAHAGINAEGWAKHGPPGSPETQVGGARTRAYRRSADKGLRRWLNRCKEPACCSSRTWGRKRNRRPPRCCFPSVLHTPIRPHARPNNRVLRPTSSETYKGASPTHQDSLSFA